MLREQFDSGQGTNNLIAVDHFIAVINLSAGSRSLRGCVRCAAAGNMP
jgi:hypothetical protein